jgi:D-amino-acid oxidase
MARVCVVGGGVIGLTVAYELAGAGHRVEVLADRTAQESVSAVAGALWFPYAIDNSSATSTQLGTSLERFRRLADRPETGVVLREGLLLERHPDTPRDWMRVVAGYTPVAAAALPTGATAGFRLTLPMVDTPRYLDWLRRVGVEAGVRHRQATVNDLAEVTTGVDAVVVAAGLRSAALLGDDDTGYPVRGQVVRLANRGLREWLLDDDNPIGMTYVLPRQHDIVCGGTADVGALDTGCDPAVEAAILERCIALVPELAGLPILSRAVGLRPGRPAVRVEVLRGWSVPVVTCYGHGGAGVTASWGSAAAVAELLADLLADLPAGG